MQTFIWVIVILFSIEALARIICLAVGHLPQRSVGSTVIDLVIGLGLIVWGATLL